MRDTSPESLPGYYCEGESGRVAVFAADPGDAMLVQRLLEDCGYERLQRSDKQSDDYCSDRSDRSAAEFGVIVCFRRGEDLAAVRLLALVKASRCIVFSNCTEEDTIVLLLKNGAHHYFNICECERVLSARLKAALRIHTALMPEFLEVGDLCFDLTRHKVSRDGQAVDLSPKEYEFAFYMFSNIERTVGNGELMSRVWSLPPEMDSRRIDTAASRVRKKLRLTPESGWELKCVRTVGYRLIKFGQGKVNRHTAYHPAESGDHQMLSTGGLHNAHDRLLCSS